MLSTFIKGQCLAQPHENISVVCLFVLGGGRRGGDRKKEPLKEILSIIILYEQTDFSYNLEVGKDRLPFPNEPVGFLH